LLRDSKKQKTSGRLKNSTVSEKSWQTGSSGDQISEKHPALLADRDIPETMKSVGGGGKPENK
jgi:hypothetical protein